MKDKVNIKDGTSFHGTQLIASVNELAEILGTPDVIENAGKNKFNFIWHRKTTSGISFIVYDWKTYTKIELDEDITWNIGGFSKKDTEKALKEILKK